MNGILKQLISLIVLGRPYMHPPSGTVDFHIYLCNVPSDSPSQYFKHPISITFLDHLATQIENWFASKILNLLFASYAFINKVLSDSNLQENLSTFCLQYKSDLPKPRHLTIELKRLKEYWLVYKGSLPITLSSLLPVTDKITFPSI